MNQPNYYCDKEEYKKWKKTNKPPGLICTLLNAALTPQSATYQQQQPVGYQQPMAYRQQEVMAERPIYQQRPVMAQQAQYQQQQQQRVMMEQPQCGPPPSYQQPMQPYNQAPPAYQQSYQSAPKDGPVIMMNNRDTAGDLMLDAMLIKEL